MEKAQGRALGRAEAGRVTDGHREVLPAGVDDVEDAGQGRVGEVLAPGGEGHPGGQDIGHEGPVGGVEADLDREVVEQAEPGQGGAPAERVTVAVVAAVGDQAVAHLHGRRLGQQ